MSTDILEAIEQHTKAVDAKLEALEKRIATRAVADADATLIDDTLAGAAGMNCYEKIRGLAVQARAGDISLDAFQHQALTVMRRASAHGMEHRSSNAVDSERQLKALAIFARTGDAAELKSMSVGSAADGGYIVPEEIAAELLKVAKSYSPLRGLASVYSAASGDFKIPISVGGTGAAWSAEGGTRSDSAAPTLAEIAPPGGELYAVAKVSQWLLDDSKFNLEDWLLREIGEQFAVTENAAYTTGDGTNKPKGITAYTTAATADSSRTWGQVEHLATGVAGDFAASNKGDKLIELTYKLKAAYRRNAGWMMPASVAAEIRQFKDSSGRYIWAESLAPGAPPMLLGYPVHENEDMPAKAASSLSIAFGDFKRGYGIVDREGMRMVRDPFTEKGQVKLYVYRRTYGALVDSNAVKFLKFAVS